MHIIIFKEFNLMLYLKVNIKNFLIIYFMYNHKFNSNDFSKYLNLIFKIVILITYNNN